MEDIISRVGQSAFNYALRTAVPIVTGYTFRQCSRLLQQTPKSTEREKIICLHDRLVRKIEVISPAIDMIELVTARGNTSLESAAGLSRDILSDIEVLGNRLKKAAEQEEAKAHTRPQSREHDLLRIIVDMEVLLEKIADAVPLLHLAITASGAEMSSKLPPSISASRLVQASTFLTSADTTYAAHPGEIVQVGPTFTVSLYMLFAGHSLRPLNDTGVRETTWKEVMHKAMVKLVRLPLKKLHVSKTMREAAANHGASFEAAEPAAEFAYQLVVVEDLDDDRVHTFEEGDLQPRPIEGVRAAGLRELLPIHEVAKLFYADTGKLLGMQGASDGARPVLLLKRDTQAEPPRRMQTHRRESASSVPDGPDQPFGGKAHSTDADSPRKLPADLDPEWLALEVYAANEDDSASDDDTVDGDHTPEAHADTVGLLTAFSRLRMPVGSSPVTHQSSPPVTHGQSLTFWQGKRPTIKTTLSLLEMMIKLAALQQYRQEPHLAIEDELFNMFLQDSSNTGHGEKAQRQRTRRNAVQRVGFDPYDESPLKVKVNRDAGRARSLKHDVPRTPPSKSLDDRIVAAALEVPGLLETPDLQPTSAQVSLQEQIKME